MRRPPAPRGSRSAAPSRRPAVLLQLRPPIKPRSGPLPQVPPPSAGTSLLGRAMTPPPPVPRPWLAKAPPQDRSRPFKAPPQASQDPTKPSPTTCPTLGQPKSRPGPTPIGRLSARAGGAPPPSSSHAPRPSSRARQEGKLGSSATPAGTALVSASPTSRKLQIPQ